MEISWITEKGGPCDPTTQKDAGGTPASQLVSSYRKNLRPHRLRVRGAFPPVARQAGTGANPSVPGLSGPDQETGAGHGQSVWVSGLGLALPLKCAAIQSGQTNNLSNSETGLDASHHIHVSPEGRGNIFFLTSSFIG
jgi:hypothetical protein